MEAVWKALKNRRSIRSYLPDPVPQDIIDRITEAGTYAPSGMNRQPTLILAVSDPVIRDQLSVLNARIMGKEGFDPFYGAPVVLVVLANRDVPTYLYDGSLVMGNLMQAAYAAGLGSCWIHRAKEMFEEPEGKALLRSLGIEGNYEGIGNCIIGYPASEQPPAKPRKQPFVYQIKAN